jgi:hypothetical protein
MTNNKSQMKVYAVIGGWEYEGEDFDSLRLFDCKSAAEAYSKKLQLDMHDYALIEEREVNFESALVA